jgi:hypothetical protein
MTLIELLLAIGIFNGIFFGAKIGFDHFGISGAVTGGLIGPLIGYQIAKLPGRIFEASIKYKTRKKNDHELFESINPNQWMDLEYSFRELKKRNLNFDQYAEVLISLMKSDEIHKRIKGFTVYNEFFPDRIDDIQNFSPFEDTETCKRKLA